MAMVKPSRCNLTPAMCHTASKTATACSKPLQPGGARRAPRIRPQHTHSRIYPLQRTVYGQKRASRPSSLISSAPALLSLLGLSLPGEDAVWPLRSFTHPSNWWASLPTAAIPSLLPPPRTRPSHLPLPHGASDGMRAFSIAASTLLSCGALRDPKRSMTFPLLSTRNLLKFQVTLPPCSGLLCLLVRKP